MKKTDRRMRRLSIVIGLLSLIGSGAHAGQVQRLTATNTMSIITNTSSEVTQWQDQSGSGNHATAGNGSVHFSDGSMMNAAGQDGLTFYQSSLELFSAADKGAILDFNGAASGHSGFAVLVAFQVDSYDSADWKDLIGTTTLVGDTEGFVIRYKVDSSLIGILGGTSFVSSDTVFPTHVPIVIGFNYDAETGQMDLWNSYDDQTVSKTKLAGDFSNGNPLRIGSTANVVRNHEGLIGEVRVYDSVLSPTEFQRAKVDVAEAWGVLVDIPEVFAPAGMSAMGGESAVDLEWNDLSQFSGTYTVYRSVTSRSNHYSLLASGLTDSTYLDIEVDFGVTYYYAVTAETVEGAESPYTDEVSAIPFEIKLPVNHTGSISLDNNDGANTATKTWTVSDLNNTDPVVSGSAATAAGTLSAAGDLGASESFSLTATSVIGWSSSNALTALSGETFEAYLAGLTAGKIQGLLSGDVGPDSRAVYAGDDAMTFGQRSAEAMVYTVDTANLSSGTLYLMELTFGLTGGSDRLDFVVYDMSASKAVEQRWDTSVGTLNGDWALENGDKIIIGTGSSNGANEYRISTLTLDVMPLVLSGFNQWATQWGGDIGANTNDYDVDGLNNLYEYGLDGNPTDFTQASATLPVFSNVGDGFEYIHPKRSDDPTLVYKVETIDDLVSGTWTNTGYTVGGTDVTGETLDFVTNTIDIVDNKKFIRLIIEN